MENKKKEREDIITFLKEKKARDGRLNRLGEWVLSGGEPLFTFEDKDLKYILR